jgi:hypothetical protein
VTHGNVDGHEIENGLPLIMRCARDRNWPEVTASALEAILKISRIANDIAQKKQIMIFVLPLLSEIDYIFSGIIVQILCQLSIRDNGGVLLDIFAHACVFQQIVGLMLSSNTEVVTAVLQLILYLVRNEQIMYEISKFIDISKILDCLNSSNELLHTVACSLLLKFTEYECLRKRLAKHHSLVVQLNKLILTSRNPVPRRSASEILMAIGMHSFVV